MKEKSQFKYNEKQYLMIEGLKHKKEKLVVQGGGERSRLQNSAECMVKLWFEGTACVSGRPAETAAPLAVVVSDGV